MTYTITAATRFVLWVKKRDREGRERWYPKRKVTHDFLLAYNRAEVDYGLVNFCMLPEGMPPAESWLEESVQPETKRDALYSVWVEGKDDGANPSRIGEHLGQEEAEHLRKLTEQSPLALGLRVWVETES